MSWNQLSISNTECLEWPRVIRKTPRSNSKGRIFVVGNLVTDVRVHLKSTMMAFWEAKRQGHEKFRADWQFEKPVLGGFVGQVAPLAANLDFDVAVACTVALPSSKLIRDLLESGLFDTQYVVSYPGAASASLDLQFTDGHMLIPRPGVDALQKTPIPRNLSQNFDAALANLGSRDGRVRRLQDLISSCSSAGHKIPMAIVARGDWTAEELALLNGTPSWILLNEAEACEVAMRIGQNGSLGNVRMAVSQIKHHLGPLPRLIVTAGEAGAYLQNGTPEPRLIPTTPVIHGNLTGPGDTLAVYVLMSSLLGLSDDAAVRTGVEAATARVAGRRLPAISSSDAR